MAVRLRLRRMGRKKRPFYRIVAADSRSPRDGRFIEEIGYYNPLTEPATVELKEDRAYYWLGVGATPSPTVKNILSREGIILKFDLQKKGVPQEKIEEEVKKWEVLQLEKQRRLEAKLAEKAPAVEKEEPAEEPEVTEAEETTESGKVEAAETAQPAKAEAVVEKPETPETAKAEPAAEEEAAKEEEKAKE